jgi:hypothetical protein
VGVPWTSGDKLPPIPFPDAGTDAGPILVSGDAGDDASTDAGPGDDAATDASTPFDASTPPVEAGPPPVVADAGPVPTPIGQPDASTTPDAGDEDAGTSNGTSSSGCSCHVGGAPATSLWPSVAGLLFVGASVARRRARRARACAKG